MSANGLLSFEATGIQVNAFVKQQANLRGRTSSGPRPPYMQDGGSRLSPESWPRAPEEVLNTSE